MLGELMKMGNIEWFLPESMAREMEGLARGSKTQARNWRIAQKVLEAHRIKRLKTGKKGDESLLELAEEGYIIATQDKGLQKRLKEKRKGFLYLNSSRQLQGYGVEA